LIGHRTIGDLSIQKGLTMRGGKGTRQKKREFCKLTGGGGIVCHGVLVFMRDSKNAGGRKTEVQRKRTVPRNAH